MSEMYWSCHFILGVISAKESLKKLVGDSWNSFLVVVFHPVNHYWRCVVNPLYNTMMFVELLRPVRTLLSFSTWPPSVCIVYVPAICREMQHSAITSIQTRFICSIRNDLFSAFSSTFYVIYEILFIWGNKETRDNFFLWNILTFPHCS